jgi:extracellular matrix protein 14
MRFSIALLLLACTTSLAYPSTTVNPHRHTSLIQQLSNYLTKWVYGVEPADPAIEPSPRTSVSKKLEAQYNGDVVLRFNITTEQDARALSEAVNTLFLDVWEFTAEWADIRVAKDVVSSC